MSKKQFISRLLQIVIVLIGISFFTFLLTYVSPGDPVRHMLTASGTMPTEEAIQTIRSEMGLNDPFFTQYFRWVSNCLKGDFGTSYMLRKPVVTLLAERLWPTLKLTIFSVILNHGTDQPCLCSIWRNDANALFTILLRHKGR